MFYPAFIQLLVFCVFGGMYMNKKHYIIVKTSFIIDWAGYILFYPAFLQFPPFCVFGGIYINKKHYTIVKPSFIIDWAGYILFYPAFIQFPPFWICINLEFHVNSFSCSVTILLTLRDGKKHEENLWNLSKDNEGRLFNKTYEKACLWNQKCWWSWNS